MPTVPGMPGPYRFYFYSFDCAEARHIHAQRDRAACKFWLDPVALSNSQGMPDQELSRVRRIILEHRERIIEAWNEHCGQ